MFYCCCVNARHQLRGARGFTIVEVLVGIGVISVLSSVGYFTVTNIQEGAKENRLQSDITSMNAAVRSYLANGGSIPADATADEVIIKLKTRADVASAAKSMGMTGSFVDVRIEPEWQTGDEAGSSQLRAVWNAAQGRFDLSREGGAGIKNFRVNNALASEAPVLESRTQNLEASDVKAGDPVWVWEYADNRDSTPALGAAPLTAAGVAYAITTSNTPVQLSPPVFSVPAGTRSLAQLASLQNITSTGAFPVIVTNPNAGDISHLTSPGVVIVTPGAGGTTISTQAISDDPDHWLDSATVTNTYNVTAFDLAVSITPSSSNVTPFQVGVPPASGAAGGGIVVPATISNWFSIPAIFRTSSNFQLVMADSSQSLAGLSGSAEQQITQTLTLASPWSFASGFPAITMNAMAKSLNSLLFSSSPVATATIVSSRPAMSVRFTPPSGSGLNLVDTITIAASNLAQFPSGYIIRYTVDSTTPSATNGTTYTSPLPAPESGTLTVKAIALPPDAYTNWFTSPVGLATYTANAGSQAGVVVNQLNKLNGTVNGSVQLLSADNFSFVASTELFGDLYVPGTPTITGNLVTSVVTGTGSVNPTGYTINISSGKFGEDGTGGTVYNRIDPPTNLPTVDLAYLDSVLTGELSGLPVIPTGADLTASTTYPASGSLASGDYGDVKVTGGGTLVIGTPGVTTVYNMKSLKMTGGASIVINGPVIINLLDGGSIQNIVGTTSNQDWLTIYSQGDLNVTGGGGVNANKIISNSAVTINGNLDIVKGVIAAEATITGGSEVTTGTF